MLVFKDRNKAKMNVLSVKRSVIMVLLTIIQLVSSVNIVTNTPANRVEASSK